MTSNIGSDLILEEENTGTIRDSLLELLKRNFRPEFLNRIDETVIFNRLGKNEIGKIVDIQLDRLAQRMAERKITLNISGAAKEFLAERGYDPMYGARPLKRAIQAELENPLAKLVISGKIREGDVITADRKDGELVFSN
jgi:ATP-dependent Clp protease ATP-binding subunit ClpB